MIKVKIECFSYKQTKTPNIKKNREEKYKNFREKIKN